MARLQTQRAALKRAHQLLAPTAALGDMLAVPPMSNLLTAVAAGQAAKKRTQAKNRKALVSGYNV